MRHVRRRCGLRHLPTWRSGRQPATGEFLDQLKTGAARVAFSFGGLDPDPAAGSIQIADGHATGTLRFVEAAGSCTHLLVATGPSALALAALDAPGTEVTPTRAMGAWGLYQVRLDSAPATLIEVEHGALDDLLLKGKLMLMARAHGAARRGFEMVTDYARSGNSSGSRSENSRRSSTSSPTA